MIIDDPNQPVPPPDDNQDQQDDSELMYLLGQEVRAALDARDANLLAQIDLRLESQPPPDGQDQQDDSELMQAMGQEVRKYIDERDAILVAQMDARFDQQAEILSSIKELQSALTSVALAPRMLIQDEAGRPIGVKTVLQ